MFCSLILAAGTSLDLIVDMSRSQPVVAAEARKGDFDAPCGSSSQLDDLLEVLNKSTEDGWLVCQWNSRPLFIDSGWTYHEKQGARLLAIYAQLLLSATDKSKLAQLLKSGWVPKGAFPEGREERFFQAMEMGAPQPDDQVGLRLQQGLSILDKDDNSLASISAVAGDKALEGIRTISRIIAGTPRTVERVPAELRRLLQGGSQLDVRGSLVLTAGEAARMLEDGSGLVLTVDERIAGRRVCFARASGRLSRQNLASLTAAAFGFYWRKADKGWHLAPSMGDPREESARLDRYATLRPAETVIKVLQDADPSAVLVDPRAISVTVPLQSLGPAGLQAVRDILQGQSNEEERKKMYKLLDTGSIADKYVKIFLILQLIKGNGSSTGGFAVSTP